MDVYGYLKILDDLPESVIGGIVERSDPRDIRCDIGEEDTAAEPVLLDPMDVGNGVVNVIEEDLTDTGAALGKVTTEIHQPTVVSPNAGKTMLVLFGPGGCCEKDEAGEKWGDGIGEDDLADDAIGFLLTVAHVVVPIAEPPRVPEISIRVLVLGPPGVELAEVLGVEVLPVGRMAASAVAVGRYDGVVTICSVDRFVASLHSCPHSLPGRGGIERPAPHLVAYCDHGCVRQRSALPIGPVDDEGMPGDEPGEG